jgi:hypothetical protein
MVQDNLLLLFKLLSHLITGLPAVVSFIDTCCALHLCTGHVSSSSNAVLITSRFCTLMHARYSC